MYFIYDFFAGCGGFGLGFKQTGFETIGAYDIDKYAIKSYKHNVDDIAEIKDIKEMTWKDLNYADVWTFGFPCTDISIAGKQKGMIKNETRSGLFYEIMRLLTELKTEDINRLPKVILAENVKMVNKYLPVIKEEFKKVGYTLYYTLYNSKYWDVPQNRERYYMIGIRNDLPKTYEFPTQQKDCIPKLSSILEKHVDEKYYMSDDKARKIIADALERLKRLNKDSQEIKPGLCIDTRQHKDGVRLYNEIASTLTSTCYKEPKLVVVGRLDMKGTDIIKRVYDPEGLSPTLTTSEGDHRQPKILERKDDTLPNYRVRKLTPREYARLQGFPDTFEFIVSDTQLYKQFGNACTVTITHAIAKSIKEYLNSL